MARGWESKSIEEQREMTGGSEMAVAGANRQSAQEPVKSSRQRDSLLLARKRIVKDLQTTENPRYKVFLETSLAAVDKQLLELK
jgi:hypothetical protein